MLINKSILQQALAGHNSGCMDGKLVNLHVYSHDNDNFRLLKFVLIEVNVLYLLLITGPTTSEQPRPTEEMNGVLNDEELPPQVIKRCEEDFQIILTLQYVNLLCVAPTSVKI